MNKGLGSVTENISANLDARNAARYDNEIYEFNKTKKETVQTWNHEIFKNFLEY